MLNIEQLKSEYNIILCTMNCKKNIGTIPSDCISSISKSITSLNEISLSINKYVGKDNGINLIYDEIKEERILCINQEEYYVIKKIKEKNNKLKEITAYSLETKLSKIFIEVEDIYFTFGEPNEDNDIYSLNDYLYQETGWKFGVISDSVKFNSETTLEDMSNGIPPTLTNTFKSRYQESVNTNWYDFLTKDVAEQFECQPIFNSYTKTIDLLDDEDLGNKLGLMLSYDNYLKSMEVESSTEDIVTRLTLKGNSELTILEVTPTGYKYIEDFSYFIESNEMSLELTNALATYNEIVELRRTTWLQLLNTKNEKQSLFTEKQNELFFIYQKMKSLELEISNYEIIEGMENIYAQKKAELETYKEKKKVLDSETNTLYDEMKKIDESISNTQLLCKKEYATDSQGTKIFNDGLLEELKMFVYHDNYSNDSFTDAKELLIRGQKELKDKCRPTKTWSIDSVNFMGKIIDNGFRQHWNGELSLGDTILLHSDDKDYIVYLVGFEQNLKDDTLTLTLSNKKNDLDCFKIIGDRLTNAKEALRKINSKQYLLNQQKYNRINL